MALDITTQDIVIDETTGLQDNDINPAGNPDPTLAYLVGLDTVGGLPPEVAYKADFVVASASAGETINSIALSQNSSGTPFSTTVGVNSGLRTVDGNYVWLFQDAAHANVVLGVIGTSDPAAAPAANGALAFTLGLVSTSNTHADLYTVQYVALLNPDANNPDDRIDLTDKVFASISGTAAVNFSQLGDAPPGHNNWYILDADVASTQKILVTAHDNGAQAEVNVSTQGLGVASQDVRFGRELQIDLIVGGTQSAGKNFTNTPVAPDYDSHIETVSSAGFSVSQSTPTNTTADMDIHAYNNDDNVEGAAFPADDNDAEIEITGATFKLNGVATTAAALGITVDLSGTGLILRNVGEGVTVDFTTAGGAGGTFDRFTIKNIDVQKDYFDIKEVHFQGQVANAYTEEVGSFINFDDDGPSISTTGTEPTATVDESDFATNATANFAGNFSSAFGVDGAGTVTYALSVVAGPSGLVDTATQQAVNLSLNGTVVEGRTAGSNALVFTVTVSASGVVTLDQLRAVVHANPSDANDSATLASDDLIKLTATVTDKDGDHQPAILNIGQNLLFLDDGPSISTTGTEATATVDETDLVTNATANFATNFSSAFGADGAGAITYALSVVAGASGLIDTLTNEAINLSLNGAVVEGRTAGSNALVFTVSVDASGVVTLDQQRAVVHDPNNGPNDTETLTSDDLVKLTATITDKDGDHQAATLTIGQNLVFTDDVPTITAAFDADPGTPGIQTPEQLGNALNQTASGIFGYDIGHDSRPASFYDATHSDFVDADSGVAGIQIGLTGTVDNAQNPAITNAVATLTAETDTSATFAFSFEYDKDPITAGVQSSTAGGTLAFDKVADTYTFTLTDIIDGFSFDILHTADLVHKQPTGNTGHPLIVAEQLTADGDAHPFFVQFTGNSTTQQIGFGFNSTGDGAPSGPPTDTSFTQGAHDMVTNVNEDWVSATQATNGVAGDTIQKGELLTLRFFQEDILGDVNPGAAGGGTERLDPTTKASGVVVKFDGIGNSEDLVVILDLKDANGNEVTRAVNVENSDLIKGNANVPAPYNTEFTLDNNDALLIIEQNDYTVAGETYQIQGMQIMQSANGLTGNAINLNGATGANGGSSATSNLTAWDATDNDVLKIVDIGFVQQTSGTIDASLQFSFALADADGDTTSQQVLGVNISNSFVV